MAEGGSAWRSFAISSNCTAAPSAPRVRGLGKGATFTVELPRVESDRAVTLSGTPRAVRADRATPKDETSDVASLKDCRALVVDDDQDARALIAMVLRAAGATVDLASSVSEALRHLNTSWPDVLIADIGMPGADGYDLIQVGPRAPDAGPACTCPRRP